MDIAEILVAFRNNDGIYKREHVDAAIRLKDEITPYLIGILEKLISDPIPRIRNENRFDHIYAAILLGHFEAHQAYETIVDVLSIPGDIPYDLFGDIIAENFPAILFRTCGGSLDRIQSLASNRDVHDLCREAALKAMVYSAVDGMTPREEVLDFFGSLFTGTEAEVDSDFWSFLAGHIRELYPEELMPVIEKAYQDELIDPWYIAPEDFEEALHYGKEYALEQIRKDMQRRMPEDVHEYMSWWACFRSEEQSSVPFDSPSDSLPTPSVTPPKRKKQKREKKNKRKMAKASRRKNRR